MELAATSLERLLCRLCASEGVYVSAFFARGVAIEGLKDPSAKSDFGYRALKQFAVSNIDNDDATPDTKMRLVLEARLAAHGYDEETLNAGALIEALVPLAAIDRFLSSARGQLNGMLKEVCVRREFADRARKALAERPQATVPAPDPKQIGGLN